MFDFDFFNVMILNQSQNGEFRYLINNEIQTYSNCLSLLKESFSTSVRPHILIYGPGGTGKQLLSSIIFHI